MKYSNEIIIDKNVEQVVSLFDSTDNMYKWMRGLQSVEHISGTPGEVGAKSKLIFKINKREMEMIETITSKNLPHEFSGTYEMKGTLNKVSNHFVPINESQTKYITENEFEFNGLMMKLFSKLMPSAFKKQTYQFMQDFKAFAEKS
ncbi:MAG: SRPBCC family protein [Chitinophagales bacterium]|nr:SRPBCC family protein [Chitinophagales bacterium]